MIAFGYDDTPERVRIAIYDPNHPGRDDVALVVDIDADGSRSWPDQIRLAQSTGEPLLGFFRQPYPPPGSLRAWR